MKSLKNRFFIGLSAVALMSAAGAYAQNSAQNPSQGSGPMADKMAGMHDKDGKGDMGHAKMAEKMKAGMGRHLAQLHDKLKLSAAQEPAWKSFTEAIAPGQTPARPDRAAMEKLTAPERMEKMLEQSKERQTRMEGHLAALKTFYAVLTPEQKKIVDASHGRMDGHRMQRRGQGQEQDHKH